jgi:hypothetical protein
MKMTSNLTTDPLPKPRRRKWLLRVGITFLVLLLVAAAFYAYWRHQVNQNLDDVVAALDRHEPGWRWDDILAARPTIPDESNGALRVLNAGKSIPSPWHTLDLDNALTDTQPNTRLTEDQLSLLNAHFEEAEAALPIARDMAHYSTGRFEVHWTRDVISTRLEHLDAVRGTARLLELDAMRRAQQNDLDGALVDCLAIVNAGRSIGDEPTVMSQLTRLSCLKKAWTQIERTLGKGQASRKDHLRALQEALQSDLDEPLLYIATKGDRAMLDEGVKAVERGDVLLEDLGEPRKSSRGLLDFYTRDAIKPTHAFILRYMTECVDASQLPIQECVSRLADLEAQLRTQWQSSKTAKAAAILMPNLTKVSRAFLERAARLACIITILAAERFRMDTGHFPENVSDLVPAYLKAPPLDPFSGESLQICKLDDGIEVRSVAEDDQPDMLDIHGTGSGHTIKRVRYRLWDPSKRGQPASDH